MLSQYMTRHSQRWISLISQIRYISSIKDISQIRCTSQTRCISPIRWISWMRCIALVPPGTIPNTLKTNTVWRRIFLLIKIWLNKMWNVITIPQKQTLLTRIFQVLLSIPPNTRHLIIFKANQITKLPHTTITLMSLLQ